METTQTEPQELTVLCYNIRIGAGPVAWVKDGIPQNLDAIADFIGSADADIVLLQEVDRGTNRVGGLDELAYLGQKTGMQTAWAPAVDYGVGEYGIGILSKFTIVETTVHELYRPDYSESNPDYPDWYSEQRVALSTSLETPNGMIRVVNTHLGTTVDQRTIQLQEVADMMADFDDEVPLIFGGDLNTEPHEAMLAPIRSLLRDGWDAAKAKEPSEIFTFSSLEPVRTIDYLFYNEKVSVRSIEIPQKTLSDHLPVLARVVVH